MSVTRQIHGLTRGVLHINKRANAASQMVLSDYSEVLTNELHS